MVDRYTIERELGRGGNAVVYLAHDRRHDRKVALKVLAPELAVSVRAERFLREIQIAANLAHPHVIPVYDSGEAEGCLYYVMPFVEGESLRARIEREPQLAIDDAVRITREVADALAYAHQRGVVHRDIKPENILLESGHAVVADFGLARALSASDGTAVSQAGLAVGTPSYMSPEQATGSTALDARTDVYSLGCVLYEMLTGEPPFTAPTLQEVLALHALEPVRPPRSLRAEVPVEVETAVLVALEKRTADRFATAAEFAEALGAPDSSPAMRARRRATRGTWVRAALAAAAVLLIGAVAMARWGGAATPSVAVLPFANIGGDTANQYVSEGITEELINALAQVEELRVPGRTSSFAFQGRNVPPVTIGAELGVRYLLEGSVQRSSAGLRVNVRLVSVADGYQVWSAQYDRPLSDVVAVQEQIARAVVSALQVQLGAGAAASFARHSTVNPQAYDHYLRGRFFWNRGSRAAMRQAIDEFNKAISLDSNYALAYSGLADAQMISAAMLAGYLPPREGFARAKAAAQRAVALDSQLAEAYVSLGRARHLHDWDWKGAEDAFRRAIDLNPRYALAHGWYGYMLSVILSVQGRAEEGVRQTRAAVELDPLSARLNNMHAITLRFARRYEESIEYHQRAAQLDDRMAAAHFHKAWSYHHLGRYREALAALDTAAQLDSTFVESQMPLLGVLYVRLGRRADALAVLRDREQGSARSAWQARAYIYAALGDRERTLEALDQMFERGVDVGPAALGNSLFDPVRSDPRFADLLRKAGLQ
jgi:serine/threonine-protein kinase